MGSICLQGGACLPPSCRRWSELAAAPPPPPTSLPCWREGRQAQPVCPPWRPCPDRTRSWPGLPACFSFTASPGCSPDIPEGTCRRQSRPGPGERAAGSPVARERHGATFPSTSRTLLHPRRSPVHRFGASTLTFKAPGAGNERESRESRPDNSGLPHSHGSRSSGLCSGRSPPGRRPPLPQGVRTFLEEEALE